MIENIDEIENELAESITELEEERVISGVNEALDKGVSPFKIIHFLSRGLEEVGERYNEGVYFVVDLIMAGDIMNSAMEILEPLLQEAGEEEEEKKTVVFGTVEGDLHDIGKNIVITLLKASGFQIYDLGTDTPAGDFIKKAKEIKPDVVAMTALLSNALDEVKNVVDRLDEEGLRSGLKIAVGGAAVSETFAKEIGADIYADNAADAVTEFERILHG